MVIGPLTTFRRFAPDAADVGSWPMALQHAFVDHALAERDRWALWIPVGFGIYFALFVEPSIWVALTVGVVGVACATWSIRSAHAGLNATLAAVAAISLGFAYAKLRTEWVATPVLSHKIGPAGLSGHIESAQVHGKGVRVVLGAVESQRFRGQAPARVRVSIRAANDVLVPGTGFI